MIQGFTSLGPAQRFLSSHAAFYNHFNTHRHLVSALERRSKRNHAFELWREMVAA